jgi:uncharacterized protein YjbJ (UPF0337 family)
VVADMWHFARGTEPASVGTVATSSKEQVLKRNTLMNEDRFVGNAKTLGGQVEEGLGRVAGDVKSQVQGKAKQMEGALQDMYGQAKETAANATEAVCETASEADDFLRTTIEQRPYTAAAVALGIGFLIGRFGRRDYY